MLGIPSLALSQAYRSRSCGKPYWETSLLSSRRVPSATTRRMISVLCSINLI
jgi:hypothetical protein